MDEQPRPLFGAAAYVIFIALAVFGAVWVATWVLTGIVMTGGGAVGGSPHVFLDRSRLTAVPTAAAAFALAVFYVTRDYSLFGPPHARVGTAFQRWVIRLVPIVIVSVFLAPRLVRDPDRPPERDEFVAKVSDRTLRAEERVDAVVRLRRWGPEVEALVRELQGSPDPAMRKLGASALTAADAGRARDLLKAFLTDEDPEVRVAAIRAVGSAHIEADEPLLDRLEALMLGVGDASDVTRHYYFQNVLDVRHDPHRQRARRLLTSTDRDVRLAAAMALADNSDFSGVDVAFAELQTISQIEPIERSAYFYALTGIVANSQHPHSAPVLWTLAHCGGIPATERDRAFGRLESLSKRTAGGEISERYRRVDPTEAARLPAWRAEYCQQNWTFQ